MTNSSSKARFAAVGKVPLSASPIRMSKTPIGRYTAPPTIGQHNDEILRSLIGLSDAKIAELKAFSVI